MKQEIYSPSDIVDLYPAIRHRKKFGKLTYYNIPVSFDIETSSFYDFSFDVTGEKRAIMYVWAMDIDGKIIMGRTWSEFKYVCDTLVEKCKLHFERRRIIIYVHNLAYEFQFICKLFKWHTVFAIDTRRPLYALTESGIEFRCSYLLSGYNLETVGKNLQVFKVQKLVGQLDYSKIRHSKSFLSEKEKEYLVNDVLVVESYIREQIIEFDGIGKIPLTKTGKVRLHCRRECFGKSHKNNVNHYRQMIHKLTLDAEHYTMCKRAFQGGFTHANVYRVFNTCYNVKSYDFTSSYPAQMVASRRFPMGAPKFKEIKSKSELKYMINHYACIFEIIFYDLEPKVLYENYISRSHCIIGDEKNYIADYEVNNGRVVRAGVLGTTITEIDFEIITHFYTWSNIEIKKFMYFTRGYLPTKFVKSILDLYGDKTKLKGVKGQEAEYLNAKEMLNSCFGMAVTDIVRDQITYDDEWTTTRADPEKQLNRYNASWQRFLYYPWGVYVTALARMALFSGILEFKNDYIYADTDSLKVLNYEKHEAYIKKYNRIIWQDLKKACDFHGFSYDLIAPETIEGVKKPLGVWDDEGVYQVFKTLGAKRYLTMKDYKLQLTLAGVSKKKGAEYLEKTYGKYGAFKHFNEDLYFPEGSTGKMTLTYSDSSAIGEVTDYLGVTSEYSEASYVHMEPASYDLSLAGAFKNYAEGVQEIEWTK